MKIYSKIFSFIYQSYVNLPQELKKLNDPLSVPVKSFISLCSCLIFEKSTDLSSYLEGEGGWLCLLTQKTIHEYFLIQKLYAIFFPTLILCRNLILVWVLHLCFARKLFVPKFCREAFVLSGFSWEQGIVKQQEQV